MLKEGPVFSLITPFQKNGDIDFSSLAKYIDLLLLSGADQIYSMAFNGKYETLSSEEIITLNTFIISRIKAIKPDVKVICGDEIYCTASRTAKLFNHYYDIGCDMGSTFFGERFYSDLQIIEFFDFLEKNTKLPVLVHEMKLANGAGGPDINWPVKILKSILNKKNILAIKEDSKDEQFLLSISQEAKNCHFIISGGGMSRWRNLKKENSFQSWLCGIGVIFPEIEIFYYKNFINGNKELCKEIENKIETPFFNLLNKVYWHQLTKAALKWRGLMEIYERLPMNSCDQKQYKLVELELEIIKSEIKNVGCNLEDF